MDILETKHLVIRRFMQEDWEDLYEYLSNENVVKYEPYGVLNKEQCKEESLRRIAVPAFWAVCLKETNKMIGHLYFHEQEPKKFLTWELGYVFNPHFYGKGYATEACMKLLEYGFESLKIRRVIARCNPDNVQSWKLLERLKLRKEGHLLQTVYFKCDKEGNPIWHDTYSYALLHEEWSSVKLSFC